ncbi:MAG: WD40-repeat-containing domain protein [Podila humilis]|nr:MAG: WD40-repeat-containing domain protein [Podila humilis]
MGWPRRAHIVSSDEDSKSESSRSLKRTRTRAAASIASNSKSTIKATPTPARGGRQKKFLEAVVSEASGEDDLEDDLEDDQEQSKALHMEQEVQELASRPNSDDEGAVQEEEDEVKDTRPRSKWFYPDILAKGTTATKSTDMDIDQTTGYLLEHLIRAHSRSTHEGQEETQTDTWACAFQPTLPVIRPGPGAPRPAPRKSSSIVATCGGNTVCLIDCQLGKVMAKYSHMEEEEFMCLAWTTLDHDTIVDNESSKDDKDGAITEAQTQQSNILAAAGHLGSIKLMNPVQNTCYRYLAGHTDSVLRLKFSLTNPRWLFSASADGSVRLWDIGSLADDDTEAGCLAKFVGLDNSAVTAIGVSEKYLIAGTEKGLMAQYDLFALEKEVESIKQEGHSKTNGRKSQHAHLYSVQPKKLYPPSQEWHESSVDDIVYIPYFSAKSYRAIQDHQQGNTNNARGGKGGSRGRGGRGKVNGAGAKGRKKDDDDGEFIFASREAFQGEILVWDATKSTDTDAELKSIFEWPIAESWTKFTVAENLGYGSTRAAGMTRQNVLVAGSTDGQLVLYDMGKKAKRAADGNIVAQKPTKIIVHGDSTELLRDVAVSEDLSMIVAGDWSNRVFSWNYRDDTMRRVFK